MFNKIVKGTKANPGSPPRVIPPAKSPSPAPSPVRARSTSPTNEECIVELQNEYDQFSLSPSPGRKQKRENLVKAVLAKPDIFGDLQPRHFAVLLAIAPEKTSEAIAAHMKNNVELFSAMITDSVVKPFAMIQNCAEFQSHIYQWTQQDFLKKELYRIPEVMQWMFHGNHLKQQHWSELVKVLGKGDCWKLLAVQGGVGPTLWEKLCQFLNENKEARDLCLSDELFLSEYLQHLSLEQKISLFNMADSALMERIFNCCAQQRKNRHVLYSVLNHCLREIRNGCFYSELVKENYAEFLEYVIDVAVPEDLESFVTKHQGQAWCSAESFKKKNQEGAETDLFSIKDRARISRYLHASLNDVVSSKRLDDELVVNYYAIHDPEICEKMWANPVLVARLLDLHKTKQIRLELVADIIPLLQSMLGHQLQEPQRFAHLLGSEIMVNYFVGAVEWLFSHPSQSSPSLENLFEHFGLDLFSGVTIEQLAQLAKLRGNNEVIFADFARKFTEKVNCYRTLKAAKEENIKKRWAETIGNIPDFVEEFKFRSSADIGRWMGFLLGDWNDDLAIVIQQAKELRLAAFLKAISQTPQINELFIGRPQLALTVLTNPEIFPSCGFTLENFGHWDYRFLRKVIRDPQLHKAYGFTPQHFYQLIVRNKRADLFHEGKGLLALLLSNEKLGNYAQAFLTQTLLMAPSYIKTPRLKSETYSANGAKPWAAVRVPHQTYEFHDEFTKEVVERNNLLLRLEALNNGVSGETWESYLNDVSKKDCEFALNVMKKRNADATLVALISKIEAPGKSIKDKVEAERQRLNLIAKLLNRHQHVRGLGIMRNPTWLDIAIRCALNVKKMTADLDLKLASNVTCFLQLPEFRPTTADLSPACLLFEVTSTAISNVVKDKPIEMIEYVIDLCHYPFEKLNGSDVKVRAQGLVQAEIEFYFEKLAAMPNIEAKAHDVQRFVCLLCSATDFLNPHDLLTLFEFNKPLRNQLCQWLLTYNLSTMPVANVPAMVQLQMLLMRSFANEQQQLDDDKIQRDKKGLNSEAKLQETEKLVMNKQRCSAFINDILWNLSCIPSQANLKLSALYQLDSQILKYCPKDALLANLLRYEFLTTQLTEKDLSALVEGDPGPDVAQACLMHDSLHERCSDEFISQCAKKLGYGDDLRAMAARIKEEWGPVIEGSPRLKDWFRSITDKDSNLLASGPR